MKTFVLLFLILWAINPNSDIHQEETLNYKPTVVLQLFTSQGCSSCPSADALLDEIKENYKDKDVYVLSYHVDYWNRLGWKDPFSKKKYSNLQYKFGSKFNIRSVYTPQLIINGRTHMVGSSEGKVISGIKAALKNDTENQLKLSLGNKTGNSIELNYAISGEFAGKQLVVNVISDKEVTNVTRGENRNKLLVNRNIVLEELRSDFEGNEGELQLILPSKPSKDSNLGIIAYVQDEDLNIHAATYISHIE